MKHVLLIDDDSSLHKLLLSFSTLHDYEIESAFTGQEGLEWILSNEYDVILLDLMMPDYSGYDLLKDLQKKTDIKELNLFVFSAADVSSSRIDQLKSLGIKNFIKKPVKLRELLKITNLENMEDKNSESASD